MAEYEDDILNDKSDQAHNDDMTNTREEIHESDTMSQNLVEDNGEELSVSDNTDIGDGEEEHEDNAQADSSSDDDNDDAMLSEQEQDEQTEYYVNNSSIPAVSYEHVPHRNRMISISVILALIAVTLFTAFVWPGWVIKTPAPNSSNATGQEMVATVDPLPLPVGATDLQKILPQTVDGYARAEIKPVTVWEASTPIEEYEVTYKNGDDSANIVVTFGQWSSAQYANDQYKLLLTELSGKKIATGKISVAQKETGLYEIHQDPDDPHKSVVLWRNDTVVFRAVGPQNAVNNFYAGFPY